MIMVLTMMHMMMLMTLTCMLQYSFLNMVLMMMVMTKMMMMMTTMMMMKPTCMLQYSFLNMVHSRWAVSRRGRSPATARLETKLLVFYVFLHENHGEDDVDQKLVVHCLRGAAAQNDNSDQSKVSQSA